MLNTKEAFLIASLFCFVIFLLLFSVKQDRIHGVRQLLLASVLGMGGNILYAFGRELPTVFAYEVANAVYAASSVAILVSYRQLFDRRFSVLLMSGSIALLTGVTAYFHYVVNSFDARTIAVSGFQVGITCLIAATVLKSRDYKGRSRYPAMYALCMCALIGGGHLARVVRHALMADVPQSLLEPTSVNLLFVWANAFALPCLMLGGLLIAHCRIVTSIEHAANCDFLTGAWSRRAFHETGPRFLERSRHDSQPLALLLIDLDNLKPTNDTYGHAAGDAALTDFVRLSCTALRPVDFLARIGGDEFALLLPDTDLISAVAIGRRLQAAIAAAQAGETLQITLSVGVAVLHADDTLHTLVKRADEALYGAKAAGHNRVVAETGGRIARLVA
ncbi:MAG TPA: GGDEF domain-containing protein [Noviherbaspirillum sp.]